MTWKQFVRQWRPVTLTRLGVPNRTVYDWRAGMKEPRGWMRKAAEFWIQHCAGEPDSEDARPRKKVEKG